MMRINFETRREGEDKDESLSDWEKKVCTASDTKKQKRFARKSCDTRDVIIFNDILRIENNNLESWIHGRVRHSESETVEQSKARPEQKKLKLSSRCA